MAKVKESQSGQVQPHHKKLSYSGVEGASLQDISWPTNHSPHHRSSVTGREGVSSGKVGIWMEYVGCW